MKTYIAFVKENKGFKMVAIEAKSKKEAFNSLKEKGFKVQSITISSVNIDYVTCEKIK